MRLLMPLLLGLLALCAELFLREAFSLEAWAPDFVAVLILWLGARYSLIVGAMTAAMLGIMADGFSGSPLGLHMLQCVLVFHAAALISMQIRFQGPMGLFLFGVAGGILNVVVLVVIGRIFLGETVLADRVAQLMVPRTVVVVLCVPLAFPILDLLESLVIRHPETDSL